MAIQPAAPQRDYEEALRSLGSLFDEQRLDDILLLERDSGFLMSGLRRVHRPLETDVPLTRFQYVEAVYTDDLVIAASAQGAARRGTGHRANRNEAALRLIGRYVNERGGARICVIDRGDSFLVRMFLEAKEDMPHRFETITSGHLDRMRQVALESRRHREEELG